MNGKNNKPKPIRVGEVYPYYVTLRVDSNLPPTDRANRFKEKEWQMGDPFLPGFEAASCVEDSIVYVEYVEAKKTSISIFGNKQEVLVEKRCKIFDLMENNKKGFILVHPNGVSRKEEHLERYLARFGYMRRQYEYRQVFCDNDQLLEVFHSPEVERKGVKFDTGFGEIQFWTVTDLDMNVYYNSCRKVEINEENINLLNLPLFS